MATQKKPRPTQNKALGGPTENKAAVPAPDAPAPEPTTPEHPEPSGHLNGFITRKES